MKQMIGKNISQAMDLCSPYWLPKRCLFLGDSRALEWLGHQLGF